MLLYLKPLSEIQIGESFQVTVTEENWKQGHQGHPNRCALAIALRDRFGVADGETTAMHHIAAVCNTFLRHDGSRVVYAFDARRPFPGPTSITFTREF